ncbi:HalOD1 output domain-containing protein [Haloarchaeobius baliensis]|uniref:HalOD1 output domain-containing protein n=1 Tax=Haloarchaeobius baliensis TaxID=1670458 RepID=UPI003F884586
MPRKTDGPEEPTVAEDPSVDGGTEWREVAQRHYDRDTDAELTTAIVYAIADAMDVEPRTVRSPPLYDCVDAAALDEAFFGPSVGDSRRNSVGSVEFEYRRYRVTVRSDGWIQVAEPVEQTGV